MGKLACTLLAVVAMSAPTHQRRSSSGTGASAAGEGFGGHAGTGTGTVVPVVLSNTALPTDAAGQALRAGEATVLNNMGRDGYIYLYMVLPSSPPRLERSGGLLPPLLLATTAATSQRIRFIQLCRPQ